MNGPVETHLLGQIRGDLHELRQVVGHLDYKVQEIGRLFGGTELLQTVRSIKPLLALLVMQGFVNIVLLLVIAFR